MTKYKGQFAAKIKPKSDILRLQQYFEKGFNGHKVVFQFQFQFQMIYYSKVKNLH